MKSVLEATLEKQLMAVITVSYFVHPASIPSSLVTKAPFPFGETLSWPISAPLPQEPKTEAGQIQDPIQGKETPP